MRTTLDIPDELYRSLKVRAALSGVPLRDVITQLLHLGLRSVSPRRAHDAGPPALAASRRDPVARRSHRRALARGEGAGGEIEDEGMHARSP